MRKEWAFRPSGRVGAALAGVILAGAISSGCGVEPRPASVPERPQGPRMVMPVPVPAKELARLPLATTYTNVPGAPKDAARFEPTEGLVSHPTSTQVIYASPGGPAVARLPGTQLKSPTWVPVVATRPGWEQVLLPSRPNGSTGWIYVGGGGVQSARSPYRVRVEIAERTLTVYKSDRRLGTWKVGVGAASTPTPTGRTFVLAAMSPQYSGFGSLVLPLGTHSPTLDEFQGDPATVALHGWRDRSTFGKKISHGCIRIPAPALRLLSRVPLGTVVLIA